MQIGYSKAIISIIAFFMLCTASGQTRLRFKTPDGFAIGDIQVKAWTPFGLEIFVVIDSVRKEFVLNKNFNRLMVAGENYKTLDSFFRPEIALGAQLTLILEPNDIILNQIIISTSKSESKLKESTVSISILKPYLVQNKITTEASHVLEQVPGVHVADNQVNIRNGNGWSYGAGSRVMVLLDDLPMLSGDAQTAQFSFIPVENIAGIEVVKSAGSVLYGSSALNGVINIRSAIPTDKASAQVSAFAGFYGNPPRDSLKWSPKTRFVQGSNGFYSKRFGSNSISISFNALNNSGYRMNEFDRRGRMSFRLVHENKKNKGLQYGFGTSAQTGKSGSFLLWQSFANGYTPLDSGYNFSNSQKFTFDPFLKYTGKLFQHKLLSRVFLLDNQINNGDTANNQSNGSSLYYSEYRISRGFLGAKLQLSSGVVAMTSETHSPLFSGKQRSRNLAGYFQADLKIRRLSAQAGARIENYRLNQFEQTRPVFRAGANYTLARFTFLRASWGQGYRFPSMAEAFISTSAGDVKIFPNPDLRPETGNNAEIGLKQGFKIGKFRGFADLAAFRTVYHNLMEFTFGQWGPLVPPLFGAGFKSVNTGKVNISGLEVEMAGEGSVGKTEIKFLGGYTYTIPISMEPEKIFAIDSTNRPLTFANTRADTNLYLKYRYKHLARMDIQMRFGDFETGISMRYNSAMLNIDKAFVSFPLNTEIPDIQRAWKELDHALIFDIRAAWYFHSKWKLNFQVLNVLNSLYMNRPADLRPPRSFQLQAVWTL